MNPAIRPLDPRSEYFTDEQCHILELANLPDDPDCSIARARVEPGITTRRHRLRATAERYVILEGRGRAEIGDLPAREVGPGDVVLIPPDCPQRIANTGPTDLVFLAICTPRFRPACYQDIDPPPGPPPAPLNLFAQ
jgi:mannose-6-phosphate isomerase-like protein (cupin superfamily)